MRPSFLAFGLAVTLNTTEISPEPGNSLTVAPDGSVGFAWRPIRLGDGRPQRETWTWCSGHVNARCEGKARVAFCVAWYGLVTARMFGVFSGLSRLSQCAAGATTSQIKPIRMDASGVFSSTQGSYQSLKRMARERTTYPELS
jgi:hypothetical protein